jgi:HlyD family secretion protein
MKLPAIGMRPLVLGLLGLGLAAAMVFVVMRSGPLAPTRVTVVQAAATSSVRRWRAACGRWPSTWATV